MIPVIVKLCESPGRAGGLPMINYWDKVHQGYGLVERCAEFTLDSMTLPDGIDAKPSLPGLENWLRNNGQA